ncbi:sulfurtransferase [Pseudonocardia ailaonensis]|uniref:sulfurtransferase n=1 Tax=Pseudonocardia ailaonensis TaxID=367279 RepID=UPI003CD0B90E
MTGVGAGGGEAGWRAPLIAPGDLAAALGDELPPVVLDVRWRLGGPPGRADHLAGHVPGALFVDLDTELAGPTVPGGAGGRHPLPSAERLGALLARCGIDAQSRVVAYDDADGSVAARAWWLLRWAGLPADRVAVLDGGWAAWRAEGRPEEQGETSGPVSTAGLPAAGSMPVLDADGAAALAAGGVLLDARAGARYRGETEPVDPRAGHVPGAVSAPSAEHVGPDGRWLAPADLAARFRALGVDGAAADGAAAEGAGAGPGAGGAAGGAGVGAYCGSGVTASSVVLALEVAGLTTPEHPAALYAGSWSDWSSDPGRPAATGPEPGTAGTPGAGTPRGGTQ